MIKPIIGITGDIKKGRYSTKIVYAEAIEKAGGCPVFLSPCSSKKTIKKIAETIDALLISGGRDIAPVLYGEKHEITSIKPVSEKRFYFEKFFLKEIMSLKKPVLGICYGLQFLNVFQGGTLYQDLSQDVRTRVINHRSWHRIKIYKESKLYHILGVESIKVNSSHHQGIKKLGKGLAASARSEDNLIEAIELKNYPFYIGVQWHPERVSDRYSLNLFKSFINAAKLYERKS
jgi:putative glutamine amidotransferase